MGSWQEWARPVRVNARVSRNHGCKNEPKLLATSFCDFTLLLTGQFLHPESIP